MVCKACAPGRFASQPAAAVKCENCVEGMYSERGGMTTCKECALGQYSPFQANPTTCQDCAAGQYGFQEGAVECRACGSGHYSLEGAAGQTGCLENQCQCENGEAAAGVGCAAHGSATCASCSTGFSLESDACEALITARRRAVFTMKRDVNHEGDSPRWCRDKGVVDGVEVGVVCDSDAEFTVFELGDFGTDLWLKNVDAGTYCQDKLDKLVCRSENSPSADSFKFKLIDYMSPSQTVRRRGTPAPNGLSIKQFGLQGGNGAANSDVGAAGRRRSGVPADWQHGNCAHEEDAIVCNRPWITEKEKFIWCDSQGNCP